MDRAHVFEGKNPTGFKSYHNDIEMKHDIDIYYSTSALLKYWLLS